MLRVLLAAATLVACGEDGSTSQECDADCRVQTAVEAWARSAPEGAAAMAEITTARPIASSASLLTKRP